MLTAPQKTAVAAALLLGCTRKVAADFIGAELAEVEAELVADPEFARNVAKNEAAAEIAHLRNVRTAAEDGKNWRASIWWLKAKSPERWDRKATTVNNDELGEIIRRLVELIHDLVPAAEHPQLHHRLDQLLALP